MGRRVNKADYETLIDAEMWAYIKRSDSYYPPDAVDLDIAGQRRVYDAMAEAFRQARPENVQVKDVQMDGISCRRYEVGKSDITVVYYHGGGFVVGGLDSHDDVCAEICDRTGYRVISVDYGLAPETIFPGCFEDAWRAFVAVANTYTGEIILAGDSAGGNLAAAVTHHARGRQDGRIVGQMLIYPGLGGDVTKGSYVTHADAPQLTVRDMQFYQTMRTGGAPPPTDDPRYTPLHDTDFSDLPCTVIVTAACDPLSSDGGAYRDALRAAGGEAEWHEITGMVHGCLRARVMSRKAAAFFDKVVGGIADMGRG